MSQASQVILMRHAETDAAFRGAELDRPLNARGRAAALAAAKTMHEAGHHPGPLLASTALAARQTAAILAGELHIPGSDIHFADDLHQATPDRLEAAITPLAVAYTLVTLIAHNPGVSDLARFLSQTPAAPDYAPAEWRQLPWPSPY